jgi:hypothetical protein
MHLKPDTPDKTTQKQLFDKRAVMRVSIRVFWHTSVPSHANNFCIPLLTGLSEDFDLAKTSLAHRCAR